MKPVDTLSLKADSKVREVSFLYPIKAFSIVNDSNTDYAYVSVDGSSFHQIRPRESLEIEADYPTRKIYYYADGNVPLRFVGTRVYENNDKPTEITRVYNSNPSPNFLILQTNDNTLFYFAIALLALFALFCITIIALRR